MNPTTKSVMKCADFLSACLSYGWLKADLDWLQELWWRYHDDSGNLTKEPRA